MALILNIETSTKNCSVSISENEDILVMKELNDGSYTHGENLHVFIEELVAKTIKNISKIDAVAISKGPGSFTGLRIGVSSAKGLCYALDKPLISVPTLALLAHQIKVEAGQFIIPMLDARRMEVYTGVFNHTYEQIEPTAAKIIDETSFYTYLDKGPIYFLGDGAEKCKTSITHKNANFLEGHFPSSKQMPRLATAKFMANDFEDLAYFEPFYLKDFLVTPKKN